MTEVIKGSCLCGAIKFEVSGVFESFFLCHCSRCQKGTGSAHAANLFSSKAWLKWISGEDKVKTYKLPNTMHQKSFCSECGSALPNTQMNGELLVVPAGSLDSKIAVRPNAHICVANSASWDTNLEGVLRLEQLP